MQCLTGRSVEGRARLCELHRVRRVVLTVSSELSPASPRQGYRHCSRIGKEQYSVTVIPFVILDRTSVLAKLHYPSLKPHFEGMSNTADAIVENANEIRLLTCSGAKPYGALRL